ncbi:MAG: F0F1 ATP synthase subunit B [Cyclobacteriaceae bacterium]
MDLLLPDIGLFFWQTVVFLAVFTILLVFVWKPIAEALRSREQQIEDSLRAAEIAKEEMENIKLDNEYLLQQAKAERDELMKDATTIANKIKEDAKTETSAIAEKMIADARASIDAEKKAALAEVKGLVASLSLEIAEKVIREKLGSDKAQKDLVGKFLDEVKVN